LTNFSPQHYTRFVTGDVVTPDLSSPTGFLLGLLGLVGIIALVYALYSVFRPRRIRTNGTDQLAHELGRIATALESLAHQRQEAVRSELHPQVPLAQPTPLASATPLNIPNPVPQPNEAEQEQPKEEPKNSVTIPLSMFGRGRG
jgi:hypothetical protein